MSEVLERIGSYEITRLIARGGMGTVYLGRQPALERSVALKRLDLGTGDPTLVRRFIQEARVAASFDHPNIVTVHDFFEHDGAPYIAMEHLPRGSLRGWIGRLTPVQAYGVLESVLGALAHAELHGVAHRDLKPENVLVTRRGGVKIGDFGIAKAYGRTSVTLTGTGAIGTPAYMAPEQAAGGEVGPATDLYAVGVMAYEMLGGAPPFETATAMATLYRHVHEPVPPLAAEPGVERWVRHLLEKDPARRPAERLRGVAIARGDRRRAPRALLAPACRARGGRLRGARRARAGGDAIAGAPAAASVALGAGGGRRHRDGAGRAHRLTRPAAGRDGGVRAAGSRGGALRLRR